jgi:hypothetical protein
MKCEERRATGGQQFRGALPLASNCYGDFGVEPFYSAAVNIKQRCSFYAFDFRQRRQAPVNLLREGRDCAAGAKRTWAAGYSR